MFGLDVLVNRRHVLFVIVAVGALHIPVCRTTVLIPWLVHVDFLGGRPALQFFPLKNERISLIDRSLMQWISGTLELTSKVRYGISSHGHPLFRFTPYDRRWPIFAVASALRDFTANVHVIIEPSEAKGSLQRGSIVQLLGKPSEHTEKAMMMMSYAYDSNKDLRKIIPSSSTGFRDDEREVVEGFTFHIDPAGCKDVDDAFTFVREGDAWKVYIHISDVDAWIPSTSTTDAVAKKRATTFYSLDGKALAPMFPPTISEESASLLPGMRKPALSLMFYFTPEGIHGLTWKRTLIQCHRSFTYEEASASVSAQPELGALRDLAVYLAASAAEASAAADAEVKTDSHRWVQEMMILYNTRAGILLRSNGIGILRRHSAKKTALLAKIGQGAFTDIPGIPDIPFILSAAEYVDARDENVAHAGLNKDAYAYATSPIRRYCDLVNQRCMKHILFAYSPPLDIPPLVDELNRRQKQEKAFTRDMFFMEVLSGAKRQVNGVAVSEKRVWIPEWKRCITVKSPLLEGQSYSITWYENKGLPRWKERIVFRAEQVKI